MVIVAAMACDQETSVTAAAQAIGIEGRMVLIQVVRQDMAMTLQ